MPAQPTAILHGNWNGVTVGESTQEAAEPRLIPGEVDEPETQGGGLGEPEPGFGVGPAVGIGMTAFDPPGFVPVPQNRPLLRNSSDDPSRATRAVTLADQLASPAGAAPRPAAGVPRPLGRQLRRVR